MNSSRKVSTKGKMSVVFGVTKTGEVARLSKISRQMGQFEIAQHFSKGRSVTVLEGRQIVKLSKDGTRVVLGDCVSAS